MSSGFVRVDTAASCTLCTETDRQTETDRLTETDRDTQTDRQTETGRETDRVRQREAETDRQTEDILRLLLALSIMHRCRRLAIRSLAAAGVGGVQLQYICGAVAAVFVQTS